MRNNRSTGSRYEEEAAAFLIREGYEILERNFYCRHGEIDLIAREGGYLVFAEVKYRRTPMWGCAAASVNRAKQKKIYQCAKMYMKQHGLSFYHPVRFDVIAVDGNEITLIKNAFGGM